MRVMKSLRADALKESSWLAVVTCGGPADEFYWIHKPDAEPVVEVALTNFACLTKATIVRKPVRYSDFVANGCLFTEDSKTAIIAQPSTYLVGG